MRWTQFTAQVKDFGQYPTAREAERVTRVVLSALGGHLPPPERAELAARLPVEAARTLADQVPATRRPAGAAEFVESVALRIDGATTATARWDVSSVLCVIAEAVGDDDLLTRVLATLPPGFALLFGRADLTQARATAA
ncbi:DUF2267 domain-containing protein [Streptomyces sp. WMMC500]|uniref:DUF2267 domain-containing protein n=1 Tax=Streptomyces sp. WMMC500 TaxID=3015154 RepID=UPI00248BD511|nr:DUF2267 domain-containing protein [Streptomyces sp. WMMC500]WBB58299.1 DUF2267 domain-containing protein [Streptomyces sp. WMMC500]